MDKKLTADALREIAQLIDVLNQWDAETSSVSIEGLDLSVNGTLIGGLSDDRDGDRKFFLRDE
jgi:hypothetical protein